MSQIARICLQPRPDTNFSTKYEVEDKKYTRNNRHISIIKITFEGEKEKLVMLERNTPEVLDFVGHIIIIGAEGTFISLAFPQ
jgi:hypothetical protein